MQNTNPGKKDNQDHAADGNTNEIGAMDNQEQVINDDGNNASGNKDDLRDTDSDQSENNEKDKKQINSNGDDGEQGRGQKQGTDDGKKYQQ